MDNREFPDQSGNTRQDHLHDERYYLVPLISRNAEQSPALDIVSLQQGVTTPR